jgi:hypothetical protein
MFLTVVQITIALHSIPSHLYVLLKNSFTFAEIIVQLTSWEIQSGLWVGYLKYSEGWEKENMKYSIPDIYKNVGIRRIHTRHAPHVGISNRSWHRGPAKKVYTKYSIPDIDKNIGIGISHTRHAPHVEISNWSQHMGLPAKYMMYGSQWRHLIML